MARRPIQIADLLRIVSVSDPTWRPGRDEILFVRKAIGEKFKSSTHLASVDLQGRVRNWTSGDTKNWQGRWAPDGNRVAFLSNRAKPGPQIFLLDAEGGEAQQATFLPEGSFGPMRWSPDGRKIAFSFRETGSDFTEAGRKRREEEGRSDAPRITESAHWRLDGDGFFMEQRYAVYVLEPGREPSKIFADCPIGDFTFDWHPDSNRLAVTRTSAARPWTDPIGDEIVIVNLDGSWAPIPGLPSGEKLEPRWSPDGIRLAYLGGDDPNDHRGVANTRLFVCPAEGGSVVCATAAIDLDLATYTLSDTAEAPPTYLEWHPDGRAVYCQWASHGQCQWGMLDLETGHFEAKTEGRHVLTLGQADSQGRIACIHSAPTQFPEVAVAEFGSPVRRLTNLNAELEGELDLLEPEERYIHASDGYPVHLWCLGLGNSSTRRPGIVEVHGGPHAQYGWTFFFEFQLLAAQGYAVAYCNPRGSKGYGQKHVEAIAGRWGDKDWLDVEATKDWLAAQPAVDSSRLGIMGGSYGGYMVNWAVTRTADFRAAITDRCVSNLISKSLNTDYPYHPGTYWSGAPYDGFEGIQELWRDSPIAYFRNVTTPMLIIHSEGDLRCHIEQGEQVFTALQELGVPARFVRYPASTSHGMSRAGPADLRMHRLQEILDWWSRWFTPASSGGESTRA